MPMKLRLAWIALFIACSGLSAQQIPAPAGPKPAAAAPAPQKAPPQAQQPAANAQKPGPVQQAAPANVRKEGPSSVFKNVVFRPTFLTADISHFAGLSFRVRSEVNGRHYLVGAHSLFGPAAELQEQLTPEQISKVIVGAVGVSINDPAYLVVAKNYVMLADARAADDKGSERDIAAFMVINPTTEPALTMDPAKPINGDRVWLYVKYPGTTRVGLEPASIVWLSDKEIRYHFDHQDVNFSGMMGAPILSPDGNVVGMHIGTFKGKSGTIFGFACPGAEIRRVIDGAAPATPAAAPKPKKSLLGGAPQP